MNLKYGFQTGFKKIRTSNHIFVALKFRLVFGDHRPVGHDRDLVATQKFSIRSFNFGRDRC
jgi:hypothetical protein